MVMNLLKMVQNTLNHRIDRYSMKHLECLIYKSFRSYLSGKLLAGAWSIEAFQNM